MLIQEMRNRSQGLVAKVIVGMIIVVFALFGFGSITTYLTPVPKVAEVGSQDITQQAFNVAVERNRRLMLAQNPTLTDVDEAQMRENVLTGLINRTLMQTAANELGLFFGESEIDEEILLTPAFQVDGVFNPDRFRSVLGGLGYTPALYRVEMSEDKKLQQLTSAIRQSAFMTSAESESASKIAQQKRDIAWLMLEVEQLLDADAVGEDDIHDYYALYAERFMTEEMIDLEYLEVKRSDLMGQIDIEEEEIRLRYESDKDSYSQPERRRFAHILIEVAEEAEDDQALQKIEDIHSMIVRGEDFGKLAEQYSNDTVSAAEGGDLGFQEEGIFVPEFESIAYMLAVNEVSAPVRTEFGYHLIKLLEVEEMAVPDYAEVRGQIENELKERKAEEQFLDLSSRLGEIAYEAVDMQEPAEILGLDIKTTGHISRSETEGIGANRRVMEVAYSTDILEDGNNSDIIAIDENHHVTLRVTDHRPSTLKPLEEVRQDIVDAIARERASLRAEEEARKIVGMLEEGSSTRYIADEYELEWELVVDANRTQLGVLREINEEAFRLPRPGEGGKSVGYSVMPGGNAFVVVVSRVTDLPEEEMLPEDIRNIGRVLATRNGQNIYAGFRAYYAAENEVWIKDSL